jgi:hypothetical protein
LITSVARRNAFTTNQVEILIILLNGVLMKKFLINFAFVTLSAKALLAANPAINPAALQGLLGQGAGNQQNSLQNPKLLNYLNANPVHGAAFQNHLNQPNAAAAAIPFQKEHDLVDQVAKVTGQERDQNFKNDLFYQIISNAQTKSFFVSMFKKPVDPTVKVSFDSLKKFLEDKTTKLNSKDMLGVVESLLKIDSDEVLKLVDARPEFFKDFAKNNKEFMEKLKTENPEFFAEFEKKISDEKVTKAQAVAQAQAVQGRGKGGRRARGMKGRRGKGAAVAAAQPVAPSNVACKKLVKDLNHKFELAKIKQDHADQLAAYKDKVENPNKEHQKACLPNNPNVVHGKAKDSNSPFAYHENSDYTSISLAQAPTNLIDSIIADLENQMYGMQPGEQRLKLGNKIRALRPLLNNQNAKINLIGSDNNHSVGLRNPNSVASETEALDGYSWSVKDGRFELDILLPSNVYAQTLKNINTNTNVLGAIEDAMNDVVGHGIFSTLDLNTLKGLVDNQRLNIKPSQV